MTKMMKFSDERCINGVNVMIPKINTIWKHIDSGRLYSILTVSNITATKDDDPITVVYVDSVGVSYSHPLHFWYGRMIPYNP